MAKDGLGDRCKRYEIAEASRRAMRGLPLLARLDGRAFHTFTRDLKRPYTLAWFESSQSTSDYAFDGRFQKLASVLAGMASAKFCKLVAEHLPAKVDETPHFDCRVWQVPTLDDAVEVFIWREDDATKNSITMAAGAYYADAELDGVHSGMKQEMLWQKGVNWNDFPSFFKRGSYLQRRTSERTLTDEERVRIPEKHRPPIGATFQRTQVVELNLPPVRKIANLSAVLFERADPVAKS